MKKTRIDHRAIYMSVCRIAAFIVIITILASKYILRPAEGLAGSDVIAKISDPVGIAVIAALFVIFEAVIMAGECLGAKRLFAGALIFMSAVLFVLLTRIGFGWYIPAALLPWLLIRLIYRYKKSRVIFLAALVLTAVFFIRAHDTGRLCVTALIFLVITGLTDLLYNARFIWVPLYIALSLLLLLMPVSKKPFDWSFVVDAAVKAGQAVDSIAANISYYTGNFGFTNEEAAGYSGLGRMGSGVGESAGQELMLYGRFKGTAYLCGSSETKLKKNGWSERAGSKLPYNGWFISYLDMLYKNGVTKEEASGFSETEKTRVEYRYIRTADFIHPVTTLLIDKDTKAEMTRDTGDFRFRRKKGKGNSYNVTWLALDMGAPEFIDMLCKHKRTPVTDYEELDEYCGKIYPFRLSYYLSKDDYVNYINGMESITKDPDLLDTGMATDRIKELAAKITAGLDSDYEKAAAIEEYLRQYEYDRTADYSDSPNFIESFLFEGRKGYCVHYASAMVELLRLCGIKARYSEGYAVNSSRNKRETAVMSGSAHAWPEAYINGIGWMVFEPTAIFPSARESGWERRGDSDSAYDYSRRDRQVSESPAEEEEAITEEEKGFFERYSDLLRLLLYAVILLILYLILYFIVRMLIKKIRYERRDDEGKLLENVRALREIIERTFSGDWENAALRDYLNVLKGEDKRLAEEVFEEYYRIRFSGYGKDGKNDKGLRNGHESPAESTAGKEKLRIYSEQLKKSVTEEYIKYGNGRFRRLKAVMGSDT